MRTSKNLPTSTSINKQINNQILCVHNCGGGFCSTPRKLFVLFGEPSPQGFVLSTECGVWDFGGALTL